MADATASQRKASPGPHPEPPPRRRRAPSEELLLNLYSALMGGLAGLLALAALLDAGWM